MAFSTPAGRKWHGVWLSAVLLAGCSYSPVLKRTESVSRDTTYLLFTDEATQFEHSAAVGGEHISRFRILAFSGDQFDIQVIDQDGDTYVSLDCGGCQQQSLSPSTTRLSIDDDEVWVTAELSAHPYAVYQLRIEKR